MFVLDAIKTHAKSGRTALINREERLSYAALDARSEAFANWLLELPGGGRNPVLVYGHKETDFLSCIYGALKSGRAYVPVDTAVPAERLLEIIADVEPGVVVNFTDQFIDWGVTVLDTARLHDILNTSTPEIPRETWVAGRDTAYILFTSGSTGKPKGVPITAANLTAFYSGLLPHMDVAGGGVMLNQVSYSFDVSCCAVYAGIAQGMSLFTVDKGMIEDMGGMFGLLGRSHLSMWVSTPSFAELCAGSKAFCRELLPDLRSFLFCGEVLTHKLCDTLADRFPCGAILNTYGPTEATVLVTATEITEAMRRDRRTIPIGAPLEGVTLRIVDENGGECTGDDTTGELLIIGNQVGPGYYRRPDLTGQSFFTDPATGLRGYRTGDICCRSGGLYYYWGRRDNQLKISGYRVELEDIENNLAGLPNIARAAVLPVWADGERSRVQCLAAFLLLEDDDGLSPLQRSIRIKQQAAAVLPPYMIPRKLMVVEAFPLNQNGKVDKKALAERLQKAATP